jgi:hypothetical protein
MKKLTYMLYAGILALGITVAAQAQEGKAYGKAFKSESAMNAGDLAERLADKTSLDDVVIHGEISEVCQAEGCWMKLKNPSGADIFIKFKDHAFLIPKNLANHHAYVYGTAVKKEVSVAEQKHLAEDAGATEKEIAKITAPKVELRVNASGVRID